MVFDFSKITVAELNNAMQASRFAPEAREAIAKVAGVTVKEIDNMPADEYKRLVSKFLREAYSPAEADPN